MKSLQTKILLVILSCVLFAAAVNTAAGVYMTSKKMDSDAATILKLVCEKGTEELNSIFYGAESSVNSLVSRAVEDLTSVDALWENSQYQESYISELEEAAFKHAENTYGAMAFYLALNPDYAEPTAGFFYIKEDGDSSFKEIPRTDLTAFERDDFKRVGWYYVPVDNGEAVWLPPYDNENVHEKMISYVVPFYKEDMLIGVIGMDIDFDTIALTAQNLKMYENGFGFILQNDGSFVYHPKYDTVAEKESVKKQMDAVVKEMKDAEGNGENIISYKARGVRNFMVCKPLRNNTYFCVSVPEAEVHATRDRVIWQNGILTLVIAVVAVAAGVVFSRYITRPLKALNEATRKAVEGDWDVDLKKTTNDEVGQLTESFDIAMKYLKKYVSEIEELAHRDAMTGIRNNTAYGEMVERLKENIAGGGARFAVALFDINNLKVTNDTYGHLAGDQLILAVCRHICEVFEKSLVFRAGGDEFIAILEAADLDNYKHLEKRFKDEMKFMYLERHPDVPVSAACGIAVYDSETDDGYDAVFARADELMYQNKMQMKKELAEKAGEK